MGLEQTTLASELSAQHGGSGGAVVIGPREAADTVGRYGASSVFYASDPALKSDITGPASALIASLISQHNPRLVLFPSTPVGKDWAGRVCGRLGLGIQSDVIEARVEEGKTTVVNPAFNGALRVSSQFSNEGEKTGLLIVRPGAGSAKEKDGTANISEVALPANVKPGMTVVESVAEKGGVPDRAGAQV